MGVGVSREIGDTRVATTSRTIVQLRKLGYRVFMELGTGLGASLSDDAYREVNGMIIDNVWDRNIVLAVGASSDTQLLDTHSGAMLISLLVPGQDPSLARRVAAQGVSALSVDMVPCTSRAQALDALSSLTSISGHWAIVEAAHAFRRFFIGQVTAAGKVSPAAVFVIDTGVAGLAAIGAASSLGATMRATDIRSETAEQVTSMGTISLYVDQADQGVSSDGHAKEMGADYAARAVELYAAQACKVDTIITTAAIPGELSPRLIITEMVESMKPGSVIVDMAAIGGGNCELVQPGESYVTENGVTIIGYINLSSRLPGQPLQLYGTNLVNALRLMTLGKNGNLVVDFDDGVMRNMTIIHDGEVTFPSPEIKVSAVPAPVATAKPSTPAVPAKSLRPQQHRMTRVRAGSVALIVLLTLVPSSPVGLTTVLVLTIVIGYYIVQNTTHALHTPLMSVTNAVSGIIAVDATIQLPSDNWVAKIIAFMAVLIISINVFGGFAVTHRMLDMFREG